MYQSRWRMVVVVVALPLALLALLVGLSTLSSHTVQAASQSGHLAPPAPIMPPLLERVSSTAAGSEGNGNSSAPYVSAEGGFVAFASEATNLVSGTVGSRNIYLRNRRTGTMRWVSPPLAGAPGSPGPSQTPSVSAHGNRVAFWSMASNLVSNDTSMGCDGQNCPDVFVRDLPSNTTILVSVSADGLSSANEESSYPRISADGRWVVFESKASNLGPSDSNSDWDIYLRDLQEETTIRVSTSYSGTETVGPSRLPSISADGRYIVFLSEAQTLVPTDTNGTTTDVFLYDRVADEMELVSVHSDGTAGDDHSGAFPDPFYAGPPSVSANGRYVAFFSYANNLDDHDQFPGKDVFVRDRVEGTTQLISYAFFSPNTPANGPSYFPSISASGRYVAFASNATNLVTEPDTNLTAEDIFLYNLDTGGTNRVSEDPSGSGDNPSFSPNLSADGRWVAFDSRSTFTSNSSGDMSNIWLGDGAGQIYGTFGLTNTLPVAPMTSIGRVFAFNVDNGYAIANTFIDPSGYYDLRVPPGRWRLEYEFDNPTWYAGRLNNGEAVQVEPRLGTTVPELMVYDAGVFLEATIKQPDGQPFQDAELLVMSQPVSGSAPIIFHVPYSPTTGLWSFDAPCGPLTLMVRAHADDWTPPPPIFFNACTDTPPTNPDFFVLAYSDAIITLSGTVHADLGNGMEPIQGAYVWVRNPRVGHRHIQTDENGQYEFRLPPGIWIQGSRYEDSAGIRYGSDPEPFLLTPDILSVTRDLTLTYLGLLDLPPPVSYTFAASEVFSETLPGGQAELYIPANALLLGDETITLVITPTDSGLPRTDLVVPQGIGYDIEAYDEEMDEIDEFEEYVRLTFFVDLSTNVPADARRTSFFDDSYNNYVSEDNFVLDEDTGELHAFINHFSKWVTDGFAPLTDPIVGLSATGSAAGTVGETLAFSATVESGDDIVYEWDFGDGGGATGAAVTHVYTVAGSYTATVSAINPVSEVSATVQVTIDSDYLPIEGLSASYNGPTTIGEETLFSASVTSGSGPISYAWDFGDGTSATGQVVTHRYAQTGTYTVTITATNPAGPVTETIQVMVVNDEIMLPLILTE